ncbi:hypothetical protein CC80DRAFT_101140 [Byssothecium circinans]|uniref:Uncharacterized protein n=1 Tax=Byssothecium circinans TaxID=147558 RepID=A0A6A5UF57_9PLEO|nr:hypothetical protein CC80DRAFT_101140 [Byssothecium circinans]
MYCAMGRRDIQLDSRTDPQQFITTLCHSTQVLGSDISVTSEVQVFLQVGVPPMPQQRTYGPE